MTIATEIYPMLSEPIPAEREKKGRAKACVYLGHCVTMFLMLGLGAIVIYVNFFQPVEMTEMKMLNETRVEVQSWDARFSALETKLDKLLQVEEAIVTTATTSDSCAFYQEKLETFLRDTTFKLATMRSFLSSHIPSSLNVDLKALLVAVESLEKSKLSYNAISNIVREHVGNEAKETKVTFVPLFNKLDDEVSKISRLLNFEQEKTFDAQPASQPASQPEEVDDYEEVVDPLKHVENIFGL